MIGLPQSQTLSVDFIHSVNGILQTGHFILDFQANPLGAGIIHRPRTQTGHLRVNGPQ